VPLWTTAPNQIWTINFTGQFRMRNGIYCYPLTVIDHYSRYLLCCHGLPDVAGAGVKPQLRRLFRRWGLPEAIRNDNGAPFASIGILGLCGLNTWWLQLGISHHRITPGSPQENGAHERLHRTLKARVARPPAANANLQQRVFNTFSTRTTSCGPTKRSRTRRLRPGGLRPGGRIQHASRRPHIPPTSNSGASAMRARSGSTADRSSSVKVSTAKPSA